MKWTREGSIITFEAEASDMPDPPLLVTWELPNGITPKVNDDGRLVGYTMAVAT